MTTLPPFSGDDPTCTKCGWTGASTEYLPYGDCVHGPSDRGVVIGWTANERLHRECQRCHHQWDEAVIPPCSCAPDDACPECYEGKTP